MRRNALDLSDAFARVVQKHREAKNLAVRHWPKKPVFTKLTLAFWSADSAARIWTQQKPLQRHWEVRLPK
jgi:hypothetical protein